MTVWEIIIENRHKRAGASAPRCAVDSTCRVTAASCTTSPCLCAWEVGTRVNVLTTRDIIFVRTGAKRAGASASRCAVCCASFVAAHSTTPQAGLCAWEVGTRVDVHTTRRVIFVSTGAERAGACAPCCVVCCASLVAACSSAAGANLCAWEVGTRVDVHTTRNIILVSAGGQVA
jgi:hypothetical protein